MQKRKEHPINNPLFTREMIRQCIKNNNLRDGKSILGFLKSSFGEFIQEALEAKMDEELGYSRYDYKEKEGTNILLRI